MKSKVTFDLNHSNEPIIKASIEHSDDVRDKIAERFKGRFAHASNIAVVQFTEQTVIGGTINELEILPLTPYETPLMDQLEYITTEQMSVLVKVFQKTIADREALKTLIPS